MKKLKMTASKGLTIEEGCNNYLEYCRQRNLREGTIKHYRQSYGYFYKYFDKDMLVEDIDANTYKDYVLHLKSTLDIIMAYKSIKTRYNAVNRIRNDVFRVIDFCN